jgi:hypothetical protein
MSSYSLENIAETTGLKVAFIKKCLQKKPHLFKLFDHQGTGDGIRLNRKGLDMFQIISERIAATKRIPDQPNSAVTPADGDMKTDSDLSDARSPKTSDFQDYQRLMKKHQELYRRLEQVLHQIENEKAKRIQIENDLRHFFTEIKPLTDNHSIEQAVIFRQNRRLRRAEIIGQLENQRFFNIGARKKLFEELKALDTAYYCKLSEHNSLLDFHKKVST